MNCEDLLPSTSIESLGHRVEHWRLKRRLEAWLDGETFLPIEISIVEEGGYVENTALGMEQGLDSILKITHRWRNQFKAVRDEE